MTALVEVLHERDPDGCCTVRVWLDDVEVDGSAIALVVRDVDPGRGWDREDWDEALELARADVSEAGKAHYEALDAATGSGYVT